MKTGRFLCAALILITTITTLSSGAIAAQSATAAPTVSSVLVNEVQKSFDAYKIEGSNYFKLRDIAFVLSGTSSQFEVSWDGEKNAINLLCGKPYTAVGGEMDAVDAMGSQTATPTASDIYLDGAKVELNAYKIGENNYFMLRDLGTAVGFEVDYDADTNTIFIDSKDNTPDELPSYELPAISDSALTSKLENATTKYFSGTKNMGVSIGIIKNGEVLFSNYGLTKANGDKVDENTIYEIASLTKLFTGTVLADLANRGLLSLDDPLEKFFDFSIAKSNNKAIRLIDLLTHTSGLPRMPTNWTNSGDPYKNYNNNKLIEYLKSVRPEAEPGSKYEYSNLGMGILGYVIEEVTGKPYEQVVMETICGKLGMENTADVLTSEQEALRATPHLANGNVTNAWTYDALKACGGLKSSAYDMVKFMAANLGQIAEDDEQLQSAFAAAQKTHRSSGERKLGLAWHKGVYNGSDILDHTGLTGGYRSAIVLCPDKDAGVVVLCNNGGDESDVYALAVELIKILMSD